MAELPSGTVTFLFTDIEGSTERWERDRRAMAAAVQRHIVSLHAVIQAHGGVHFKTVGDAVQAAFPTAPDAVAAALEGQRALCTEDWGEDGALLVRMGLHAGEAVPDERGDYLAAPLNRLSRLLSSGYGGQILLSQTVQQLSRGVLPSGAELRDLGDHRLRDLLEPERVFQLLHPDLPDEFPPLKTLESRPNNLPFQPTPFLGREQEVEQVVKFLRRPEVRLLTLTGPGGTGKTRLALQASADVLDDFSDGVFFVSLAPLTDPELVVSTIATTLGIREEASLPVRDRLQNFLATKQLLLVLDNVEHLAAAGPAVGELLGTSAGLKVLATSRMPLHLRAEHEYPVPPLSLPHRQPPPTAEQLLQYEAVRLFIERAQAVKPDFAITNDNAPAVAEICWRLDGLPLAIELAAARVRMLSPQAMLVRLEQRLPFLTGGARDAPHRQRTLHDTIAWSYDLLQPEEQQAFRQLAVFAGGMTFEAAEAVTTPDGRLDFFGGLERLVEQSLIRQETGTSQEPRFSMLATIRELGLQLLEASGEAAEPQARHATFFLALATEAAAALQGPQQLAWLERMETEHDNMRSALGWALQHDPETALGLVAALYWFWFYRGHLREGHDWTEQALATGASAKPEVRARALNHSSAFARKNADPLTASARAEQALALARSVGDHTNEGWALINLGILAAILGDPKRAATLFSEAETRFVSIGECWGAAAAMYNQGVAVGSTGDIDRQRALFERSLVETRAIGDRIQASWTLIALGNHERDRGNLDRARTLLEEALATARDFRFVLTEAEALRGLAEVTGVLGEADLTTTLLSESEQKYRELGHGVYLADALNRLGYLALRNGDHERARSLFEEAVHILRDLGASAAIAGFLRSLSDAFRASGDYTGAAMRCREGLLLAQEAQNRRDVTNCLTGLAGLAVVTGRHEEAARLFGSVETLRKTVGPPGFRHEVERQSQDMATVRDALGTDAELEARFAGQVLPLEEAVREALALADDIVRAAAPGSRLQSLGETP